MTRAQKIRLAKQYAEAYELEELKSKLKAAIDSGGTTVTSWSDMGVSMTSTVNISPAQLAGILALAIKIKNGLNISPGSDIRKIYL